MSAWLIFAAVGVFGVFVLAGLVTWAHYRPQDFAGDIAAGVQDLT